MKMHSIVENTREEILVTGPLPENAVKSLANSIFKSLCNEGCNPKDIIGVSSQLLSLVTTELKKYDDDGDF